MNRLSLIHTRALLFICFVLLLVSPASAADNDWRPITPAELSAKAPVVEPDADAEVLFWEVRVDDAKPDQMVMKHYIRVKVFTERGREKYSKVDIPYVKGIRIKDITARVIKPDGSIIELTKNDVFEREIVKTDKIKVKAKSFAIPNIETGVVVEYRYQEVYSYGSAEDMRMTFQHDVPIRNISYYFKPFADARYLTFNMKDSKFVKDKGGFYRATLENVPAIKEEPQMPPQDEIRSWLLVYYDRIRKNATANDFWSRAGGYIAYRWEIKDTLKPGKEMKAAAESIAAGAATPNEKLTKLFEFCKTKVKNITYDTTLTDEQKEEIKPNKSTLDTYKKLQGTDSEVNELFASLADSLGFETRLAFGGDRSEKFFDPTQAHESFVHFSAVGVKVEDDWRYYSPGDLFVPYGMLAWNEEGTSVLLLGYKDYLTTETPMSTPQQTVAKRTGKFTLLEDGTLEGTVRIEYRGHLSTRQKLDNYKLSPNKQEEDLKDAIKAKMSTAEISEVSIENVTDPEKPFVYKYKIRVPNYAQRTGKRLFLQPGFFTYGDSPMFSSATRQYPIFFHFPWSEDDDIEITLPAGFQMDNAEAPQTAGDPSGITKLQFNVGFGSKKDVLIYRRNFYFGAGGNTLFSVRNYQPLKNMFDTFHKSDTHTITLKQE